MKKLMLVGLLIGVFAFSADAQRGVRHHKRAEVNRAHAQGNLTRFEKMKLHQNDRQYHRAKRQFLRDGRISPRERYTLHKMRQHDRRETFRFKNNARMRVGSRK